MEPKKEIVEVSYWADRKLVRQTNSLYKIHESERGQYIFVSGITGYVSVWWDGNIAKADVDMIARRNKK